MNFTRMIIAIAMAGTLTACSSINTINGVRMNVSHEDPESQTFCGVQQVLCILGGMIVTGAVAAAIIGARKSSKTPTPAPVMMPRQA